jgi:hypothetical protein
MSANGCTWEGCDKLATKPQIAKDGEQWANLCDEHAAKVDAAAMDTRPGAILSTWIRAQGGPKAAARRFR